MSCAIISMNGSGLQRPGRVTRCVVCSLAAACKTADRPSSDVTVACEPMSHVLPDNKTCIASRVSLTDVA